MEFKYIKEKNNHKISEENQYKILAVVKNPE